MSVKGANGVSSGKSVHGRFRLASVNDGKGERAFRLAQRMMQDKKYAAERIVLRDGDNGPLVAAVKDGSAASRFRAGSGDVNGTGDSPTFRCINNHEGTST